MKKASAKKGIIGFGIVLVFCALIMVIVISVIKIIQNPVDKVKGYLAAGNENAVVLFYNSEQLSTNEKAQLDSIIGSYITKIRTKWDKGTPEDNSTEILSVFTKIDNSVLASNARRHISYITSEEYLSENNYTELVKYYNNNMNDMGPVDRDIIETEISDRISAIRENWLSENEKFDIYMQYLNCFSDLKNDRIKQETAEIIQYSTIKEYLKKGQLNNLTDFYNKELLHENIKKEADSDITAFIDGLVTGWSEGTLKYNEARDRIRYFVNISEEDISLKSKESLAFISAENEGNAALRKTLEAYKAGNYLEAMKSAEKIPVNYSQIKALKSLYSYSRDELLSGIKEPQSVDEYNESVAAVNDYIKEIEDSEFIKLREELSGGMEEYREVYHFLNDAADFYESEAYIEAFSTIRDGYRKYPNDKKIRYALSAFEYAYIVNITNSVIDHTERNENDEAKEILENAIQICDCDEFQTLLEEVSGGSDYLYSPSAELSDNGYLISKTGDKLLLDAFTADEEDSILSLSGSLSASLLKSEDLIDVRKLADDMSGWGKDEYDGARLSLDAVGIKSLVGALKYAKHGKDNISEGGETLAVKKMVNVPEMLNDIRNKASVVKLKSKKSGSAGSAVRYEPVITVNQSLSDRVHPLTGVKFVQKKLDYSDGRHITGVFPKFESVYDVMLPKEYWKASSDKQLSYLSDNLTEFSGTIKGQKKLSKVFDSKQIKDINSGKLPEGFVWHYNEKEGLMQVIDEETHKQTGHTEGISLWTGES